jgi:hypothetical protein
MWNLNDDVIFITNFDVFVLKTIIIIVWNTRIFVIFSLVQIVFAKSFENLRTFFFLTMLILSMRELIFLEINTFKNAFSVSRRSFNNLMNEINENYFFEKKNYFFCLMIWFFEIMKSFFCFSLKHFVSIFRLSQKC